MSVEGSRLRVEGLGFSGRGWYTVREAHTVVAGEGGDVQSARGGDTRGGVYQNATRVLENRAEGYGVPSAPVIRGNVAISLRILKYNR